MKTIKNIDSVLHTYEGQTIAPGNTYEIQPLEETKMANCSDLLSDIGAGKAQINAIEDVNEQINTLKDNIPKDVTTLFEKNDKVLKLASGVANVNADTGEAVILFQVPGTPGTSDGRYLDCGVGWFDPQHNEDTVKIHCTDEDNLLGGGAGALVESYTDTELPSEQQGWRIPAKFGHMEVDTLGGYGFVPAGFYVKVIGQKGGSAPFSGKMFINVKWGKKS